MNSKHFAYVNFNKNIMHKIAKQMHITDYMEEEVWCNAWARFRLVGADIRIITDRATTEFLYGIEI
jgi:hypothetical protein